MEPIDLKNVPPDVRKFIYRCVDSVELIQILLLLRRNPEREWTLEELTSELRSSTVAIEKRLRDLYGRKVLKKDPATETHSYIPYDSETGREIDEVTRYNAIYPQRMIELIYARPEEAMREFANAFNFKKDK